MKKKQRFLTYTKEQAPSLEVAKTETAKVTDNVLFKRRRLGIMFVVAFIVFLLIGFNLFKNSQRLLALQETKVQVTQENKQVMSKRDELANEVDLLHDDDYVAKIARAKYFYSKEGEQVYSIPELNSSTQTSGNK
ncbi:hypothetical protein CBF34_04950 [Vagococcus penaei]|uniref:Uncharacterized protein n=1 Tax=Vagococcus penaei TaxID=633807 RepID=A0A1Q2D6K0_9ENTE|nr:septum formation initiator family protein [Vagococcus penaei]AQP53962.1 hypothetical protein BW732_06840 [Vagococcus penaei]RSU02872.1 hypothetical protein CBF34_04950 [Vagococcus penaei]